MFSKKVIVLIIIILLSCVGIFFLFVQGPSQPESPTVGRLYIETSPKDARIRFLTTNLKFHQGIELNVGEYQIEVLKDGYITTKETVMLHPGNNNIRVELKSHSAPSDDRVWITGAFGYQLGTFWEAKNDELPGITDERGLIRIPGTPRDDPIFQVYVIVVDPDKNKIVQIHGFGNHTTESECYKLSHQLESTFSDKYGIRFEKFKIVSSESFISRGSDGYSYIDVACKADIIKDNNGNIFDSGMKLHVIYWGSGPPRTVKAISQENRKPSEEELQEFLRQYVAASRERNFEKTAQFVQKNREYAQIVATFLDNQGKKAYRTGDYETALYKFMMLHELYQQLDNPSLARRALNNIGTIYQTTGKYQRALGIFQESLTIFRAIGDRAGEGAALNNIGMIYQATGEYQQALHYLQEALPLVKTLGDRTGEGATLNNIGTIYHATGEYQQALHYFQEVLPLVKAIGDRAGEGRTLNNIGLIYRETGEYQKALNFYQESLIVHRAIGDREGEGTALNNIGKIHQATLKFQQALDSYRESLTIHRAIGDRGGEGTILNNIGTMYTVSGEYQQALRYLQKALTLAREIDDREGERVTLVNIGFLYEQQELWDEAVEYNKQAIALLEVIRSKAGGSEAKESFLGQRINVYLQAVKCLFQLNASEEAFIYTERSKARSFLEQLYEASTGVKHGVDHQLLEEETNLYGKLSVIEQNLKKQLSDEQREQLLKERNSLEHELSVLQIKLRTSNPRYAELKYPQPVTVEQVQQEIHKEGEVLVEYLQGEEELYAFIIGKTKFSTHSLKIDRQNLIKNIEEVMDNKIAYDLYQIIFQPLEKIVAEVNQGKDIQNLIIIPDGVLFYLPFEMLVTKDGEKPEYLVDRYTISYAPSASVLKPEILQTRQPERYAQDLLALAPFGEGGAVPTQIAMKATEHLLLSDTPRSGLENAQPLPYSAEEVQTISSLYPQSVCKIGADATKAYLKDHARGNRYLHLSTHGYLDSEHAMYSGLLFSDGMLQTYEIFNLDIDAELTVLSACQTGLGELKAGEGLVGLTRAFMYAGSPSVLVSLWPVSDPSTAAFMKRFYRNLNKGMTKAKALQETKIWMKEKSYHTDEHDNVIRHDDPFYWAPFILVGSGGHSLKETPPAMPTPTIPKKLSQEDVLTLQKRLIELGYNPGPVDGIWGKKTEAALKKFQQDNDLSVTGKLNEETQNKLGL